MGDDPCGRGALKLWLNTFKNYETPSLFSLEPRSVISLKGLSCMVFLVHRSGHTDLSLSRDGRQPFSEDHLLACLTFSSHVVSLIMAHGTCPGVCGHFDSSDHSVCYWTRAV